MKIIKYLILFIIMACGKGETPDPISIPTDMADGHSIGTYLIPSHLLNEEWKSRRDVLSIMLPTINEWNQELPLLLKKRQVLTELLDKANITYRKNTRIDNLMYDIWLFADRTLRYASAGRIRFVPSPLDLDSLRNTIRNRIEVFNNVQETVASFKEQINAYNNQLVDICEENHIDYLPALADIEKRMNGFFNEEDCSNYDLNTYEALYSAIDGAVEVYSTSIFTCPSKDIKIAFSDVYGVFPDWFNEEKYNQYIKLGNGVDKDFFELFTMSRILSVRFYQKQEAQRQFDLLYKVDPVALSNTRLANFFGPHYGTEQAIFNEWLPVVTTMRPPAIEKEAKVLKQLIKSYFDALDDENTSTLDNLMYQIKMQYTKVEWYNFSNIAYLHLLNSLYTMELDKGI